MAKTDNLTDFLTDVADAIREKKGTSDLINPQDFSDEIKSIESGGSVDNELHNIIEVELPASALTTSTPIKYLQLPNNDVVIAANDGIYTYDFAKKELIKHNDLNGNSFQIVDDVCLIPIKSKETICMYNMTTKEFSIVHTGTGTDTWSNIKVIPSACIMLATSSRGALIFDRETKTVSKQTSIGGTTCTFCELNNGDLLISASSGSGIFVYNHKTKTIDTLNRTTNAYYDSMELIGDDCLIGTSKTNFSGYLYIYRSSTNSLEQVSPSYFRTSKITVVKDKALVSSIANAQSNASGLYLYKYSDNSFVKVYDGEDWSSVYYLNDEQVLLCTKTSGKASQGIILYKYSDDVFKRVYDGDAYNTFNLTSGYETLIRVKDRLLITSSNNAYGNYGIKCYDESTETMTQLWTDDSTLTKAYSFLAVKRVGDNYIFTCRQTSIKGVYLYKYNNNSLDQIIENGSNSQQFINVFDLKDDMYLIGPSSSSFSGLYLYNNSTEIAELIYSSGYTFFDCLVIDNFALTTFGSGVLKINLDDFTAVNLNTNSKVINSTGKIFHVNNRIFISSRSASNNYNKGVFEYNALDDSFTRVISFGDSFDSMIEVNGEVLLYYSGGYGRICNISTCESVKSNYFSTIKNGYCITNKSVYDLYSKKYVFLNISIDGISKLSDLDDKGVHFTQCNMLLYDFTRRQ